LNRRPADYESAALPAELERLVGVNIVKKQNSKKSLKSQHFYADIRIRIILYYSRLWQKKLQRSVFMAIESISGSSGTATTPVRTNSELTKKEDVDTEERYAEKRADKEQEDERRSEKVADDRKMEEVRGVKEVDTNA
jgi:hypothetical protein